jgi:hypothetical protein
VSQQLPPPPPHHHQDQDAVMSMDASMVVPNNNANAVAPSWDNALVQPLSGSHTQGLLCTIVIFLIEY